MEIGDYVVEVNAAKAYAAVQGSDGRPWFKLRLYTALDTVGGVDETFGEIQLDQESRPGELLLTTTSRSTVWETRVTTTRFLPDRIESSTTVTGSGRISDLHLLGGRRTPRGFLPSGSNLTQAWSPNPDHPTRVIRDALEAATIGPCGEGSEPGIERWLFSPAPWCFAVTPDSAQWFGLSLVAPISEQTFTNYHYAPVTGGFSLRLEYEGHTAVEGSFRTPLLVLHLGGTDPEDVITRHRALLDEYGVVPRRTAYKQDWWQGTIFCGWGAQCAIAARTDQAPQPLATQANYDKFLETLADQGIVPQTVVIDDKWQQEYATCRPDPLKWPDLRGWIAKRHAAGQRVLLWWKAWDEEGAPVEACITDPAGLPVGLDPEASAGRDLITRAVEFMLSPDGLDADGFKIDFTARTPSGASLRHSGSCWGTALLHEQLRLVYDAAKRTKSDALVVTHTPNSAFVDVTDMIRLNDVLHAAEEAELGYVGRHMTYRAGVVKAACPELGIDTDGWMMPSHAEWREYLKIQHDLGVPALYYVDGTDTDRHDFGPDDFAAVRDSWRSFGAAARE
ncbi:alpha-amylase family protein [Kribbella endophytica]